MRCPLLPLLVLWAAQYCHGELRLLQIVYQNGHRKEQDMPKPTKDPNRITWKKGPAIAVVGMFQLYRLGQRLRRKYSDFVQSPTEEVDLAYPMEREEPCSSPTDCFETGFHGADGRAWGPPKYKKSLAWEQDLRCPRMATSRLYDSEEGNQILGDSVNLYEYWSRNSGKEIRNPTDAHELYESLLHQKSLNSSTPSWVDRFWPELRRQSQIHFSWLSKNQMMQKMAAGPLLGLIVKRMQKHVDGLEHEKYFMYSGKNSSLAGLLAVFGAYDGVEPPPGASLVIELHRFGERFYVRVLFFVAADSPEVVVLRDCTEYCPFEQFKRLAATHTPHKWEQHCGLDAAAAPRHQLQLTLSTMGSALMLLNLIGY